MMQATFQQLPRAKPRPAAIVEDSPSRVALASLVQTEAITRLADTIVAQWRLRDSALFAEVARYGIHPTRQILLHGPPGNGKTTAAYWIANQAGLKCYRVLGDQLVGSLLGETSNRVAEVLDWIAAAPSAVVLIDEADTLFPSRDQLQTSGGREIASCQATLWQRLDRWTGLHLFVLATNRLDTLDPAIRSRIEQQIELPPPTPEQQHAVIDYWAEVFHAYHADEWAVILKKKRFKSFREIWQAISTYVRYSIIVRSANP
jgi:ATP-dependent 26S proteasome regulatory subunit